MNIYVLKIGRWQITYISLIIYGQKYLMFYHMIKILQFSQLCVIITGQITFIGD